MSNLLTLAVTKQRNRYVSSKGLERVSICLKIGIVEYATAIHVGSWNFEISGNRSIEFFSPSVNGQVIQVRGGRAVAAQAIHLEVGEQTISPAKRER